MCACRSLRVGSGAPEPSPGSSFSCRAVAAVLTRSRRATSSAMRGPCCGPIFSRVAPGRRRLDWCTSTLTLRAWQAHAATLVGMSGSTPPPMQRLQRSPLRCPRYVRIRRLSASRESAEREDPASCDQPRIGTCVSRTAADEVVESVVAVVHGQDHSDGSWRLVAGTKSGKARRRASARGRELMAVNLRCMLRGHKWGPVEGLERGAIRTCTGCGKVKHVHADPPPEIHDIGR